MGPEVPSVHWLKIGLCPNMPGAVREDVVGSIPEVARLKSGPVWGIKVNQER